MRGRIILYQSVSKVTAIKAKSTTIVTLFLFLLFFYSLLLLFLSISAQANFQVCRNHSCANQVGTFLQVLSDIC